MPNLLDTLSTLAGNLIEGGSSALRRRDAPPPYYSSAFMGATGIPAPVKSGEGLKVYQRNPWAYAGTNAIVDAISTTELYLRKKVVQEDGTMGYEPVYEHQALELLENPIPKGGILRGRSYLTKTLLKKITWLHLIGSGEGFWAVGGRVGSFTGFDGVPTELHPLVPEGIEVRLGKDNYVEKYIYTTQGKRWELAPEDVVHFKLADPRNPYRGQSAYMSAGVALDTDYESDQYIFNWFKNRAQPDTVMVFDEAPSTEEQERIRESWKDRYEGTRNAGRMGFLWGGKDIKDLSKTQREMQFKELKEFNRDTIMANLRVGKGMAGMMEDQSRANAEAQDYVFGKRVILPFLIAWCEQLTYDYLPLFGGIEGLEFCFDQRSVVPDDETTKSTIYSTLWNIGAVTANEVRAKHNLPPRPEPEADELFFPLAHVPAGTGGFDTQQTAMEYDPGKEGDDSLMEPDFSGQRELRDDPIKITKAGSFFNELNEIAIFKKNAKRHVAEAIRAGIALGVKQTESKLDPAWVFDLPAARQALETISLTHAVQTLKTTLADLQKVIDQAIKEGRSNQELARAITRKYGDEYQGYRSVRIARTEMTAAVNAGSHQVLKQENVDMKVWVAKLDDRVRDSHAQVDAETHKVPIRLDDDYVVGGARAAFPGDPSLPPQERINCRCAEIAAKYSDIVREKQFMEMFLRAHGSLEKSFARSLRSEFGKQKQRVLDKLKY